MTYHEHVNVALAVAMPDGGLITPVLKDADKTDIYQVREEGRRAGIMEGKDLERAMTDAGPTTIYDAVSWVSSF